MNKYSLSQILSAHQVGELLDGIDTANEMCIIIDNDNISVEAVIYDQCVESIYSAHPSVFWGELLEYFGLNWDFI